MKNFGRFSASKRSLPYKTRQLRTAANQQFIKRYRTVAAGLPPQSRRMLRKVLGIGKSPSLCWGHASHIFTRNSLSEALALCVADAVRPIEPLWFVTLIHDGWRTPARSAVVDLLEIRQRARDCLRDIGFAGIGIIEFDVLIRPLSDPVGHQILPHIHAFGHLDVDTKVRRKKLSRLRRSKRLTSFNGAPTVVCKALPTADDIMHAICYAKKLPQCVKRMVPQKGYPGHERMRSYSRRQQHALLTVIELLSRCRQKDLIFSVGGRSHWLTEACKEVDKSRASRAPWFSDRELSRLWRRVRRKNRFAHWGPMFVRTRK